MSAPYKSMRHISQETRRLADQLVLKARTGRIEGAREALAHRAIQNPKQAADLLLLLACRVAELDPRTGAEVPEDRVAYLRRMHAEYTRLKNRPEMRTQKVIYGEREYQRTVKRKSTAKKRAQRGQAA